MSAVRGQRQFGAGRRNGAVDPKATVSCLHLDSCEMRKRTFTNQHHHHASFITTKVPQR
ncbi:MAG: hypothetical protein JWL65_1387 [Gammaproteobacteria bacterium]|nr:hypothetical protein [Gammaproteobacteria bacterium]